MIQDASTQLLRRLERGAVIWCVLAAGAVLALAPSRTDVLLGIAGGGVLAIVSFYAIRGSVDAAVRALAPGPGGSDPARARLGPLVVKMTGRYALLALLAYVMIARLRLHPLGLLLGMTALAASATAEAVRSLGRPGAAS
ncbi:MAG TPA: ATP synthase subunit I [Vicinamibacterales bacterium]|nr:ATP synthase subunit I [Vicinamibacterales bacterium]